MISKEDILHKHAIGKDVFVGGNSVRLFPFNDALQAMDEYAKEIAIGFAKWILKDEKGFKFDYDDRVWKTSRLYHCATNDFTEYTTEQLFQSYLNTLIQ